MATFYKYIFSKRKSAEKLGFWNVERVLIWMTKVPNFPLSHLWKKSGLKLPNINKF